MHFALNHAKSHRLQRIVYVAPFTNIIEQDADEFRKALAPLRETGLPDPVIEHHSSVDPDSESTWSRLAAENWDAPLVVTTAVQFYESLFAIRTSRCRKLHLLAKSVFILDDAQAIPLDYLEPCLRALEVLAGAYGATIVLCTATQPAIHRRDDFSIGLDVPSSSEIMPDPEGLFQALRRVDIRFAGKLGDQELADRLLEHGSRDYMLDDAGLTVEAFSAFVARVRAGTEPAVIKSRASEA
jgi:CRISPR-associated endonuclease/helicase Cas3